MKQHTTRTFIKYYSMPRDTPQSARTVINFTGYGVVSAQNNVRVGEKLRLVDTFTTLAVIYVGLEDTRAVSDCVRLWKHDQVEVHTYLSQISTPESTLTW